MATISQEWSNDITYSEQLELHKTMAVEWHRENDKPEPVRKALKYIKQQKERLGIK